MSRKPVIVTLRALGLGDFLTAVPALRALERAFPRSRHLLATPSVFSGLSRLAGLGAEIIDTRELTPLPSILQQTSDLLAVNLHGSGPQSHRALLDADPRELVAFHNPEIGNPGPTWNERDHEVTRWCRLLEEAGIAADPTQLTISTPNVSSRWGADGSAVVHPGAKDVARRWPVERWAEVSRQLVDEGERVILTGSTRDRARALEVARRAGLAPQSVLAGTTDLVSLAAIVAEARLVICGDTGVAHLATALQTPSVILFGPTDPALWGPPRWGPHVVLWKGTTGDPHADTPDPGLLALTSAEVLSAAAEVRVTQPQPPGRFPTPPFASNSGGPATRGSDTSAYPTSPLPGPSAS